MAFRPHSPLARRPGQSLLRGGDLNNPAQPATEPFINGPAMMDQAWSVASLGDRSTRGTPAFSGQRLSSVWRPNPNDEPMNRRPCTPTIVGSDSSGYNVTDQYRVSGFRSMHANGCNFLYADGSVHWVQQTIDPAVYRALSTYAGGEVIPGADGN